MSFCLKQHDTNLFVCHCSSLFLGSLCCKADEIFVNSQSTPAAPDLHNLCAPQNRNLFPYNLYKAPVRFELYLCYTSFDLDCLFLFAIPSHIVFYSCPKSIHLDAKFLRAYEAPHATKRCAFLICFILPCNKTKEKFLPQI